MYENMVKVADVIIKGNCALKSRFFGFAGGYIEWFEMLS